MLTDRFADALVFAENLHRRQKRRCNDIPYVAHLLAVTATVLEWGGDEDTAIAALLHDAVEDQGGRKMADMIKYQFGDRVAELVLHCTDSFADDPAEKLPWIDRKTAYLARLPKAGAAAALITAADKLHNVSATIRDVRAHGVQTLDRFENPDGLVWYYESVAEALSPYFEIAPITELKEAVAGLSRLVTPQPMAA